MIVVYIAVNFNLSELMIKWSMNIKDMLYRCSGI